VGILTRGYMGLDSFETPSITVDPKAFGFTKPTIWNKTIGENNKFLKSYI
jgi:hypothetical protein